MNISYNEPIHTIDYFVKGWETDNQKEGYTNHITYNYITKDLTNYINTISTHTKTETQVKQELQTHYYYNWKNNKQTIKQLKGMIKMTIKQTKTRKPTKKEKREIDRINQILEQLNNKTQGQNKWTSKQNH